MRERDQRLGWRPEGRAGKADAEVTLCLSDSPASLLEGTATAGGGGGGWGEEGEKKETTNHVPLCAAVAAVVCPLRACGTPCEPGGDRVLFIRVIENKCPRVALGWIGWTSYKQLPSCFRGREAEEGELGNAKGEKGRPVLRYGPLSSRHRPRLTSCWILFFFF